MHLLPMRIVPMVEISSSFLSASVQLLVSAGFASLVVQLLLVRQNRRKIEGEASGAEASAASVLSGAALQMVESAQADAVAARTMASEAQREQNRLWGLLNTTRWDLNKSQIRVQILEAALTQAQIKIPPLADPEPPPANLTSLDPPHIPPPEV